MNDNMVSEIPSGRRKRCSNGFYNYHDEGVLLGNWFEERVRKEDEAERLEIAFANNELPFQKLDRYTSLLSNPINLTRNVDGYLHHGDIVRLRWTNPEQAETLYLAALPQNIALDGTFDELCLVLGSADARTMARNAVCVYRNNNFVPNHVPLVYGEMMMICTVEGTGCRLLNGEPKSFTTKSGYSEVTFVKELSGRGLWRILCVNKDERLKTEGQFVPCNTDVVVRHVASGQNLSVEKCTQIKTVLGFEREISVHSYMNRYKKEDAQNIWQIEAPLIRPEEFSEPIELHYSEN